MLHNCISELKQNLFDVIGNGIFVAVAYLSLFALALAMYIWACTADPGYVEIIDTVKYAFAFKFFNFFV